MKKYLAVFLGSDSGAKATQWEAMDEKTRGERERAGMEAWQNWMKEHGDAIVETGAPLGTTKLVDPKGVSGTRNQMAAYVVVQASSHEAAAKLFVNHPHFTIFPGDSVEVMECLPIPGM